MDGGDEMRIAKFLYPPEPKKQVFYGRQTKNSLSEGPDGFFRGAFLEMNLGKEAAHFNRQRSSEENYFDEANKKTTWF